MRPTATKQIDTADVATYAFGVASIAARRPAPAEAVFSCPGGAVYSTRSPRDAELCLIQSWSAEHGVTTHVDRPARIPKTRPGPASRAGDRYACGKLKPVSETATEEHQAKRRALVGEPRRARNAAEIARHEALASTPIRVLQARGLIFYGDRSAGERYARLFAAALPDAMRLHLASSIMGNLVAGGGHTAAMAILDEIARTEKHPITGAEVPVGTWDREQYLAAREALEARGSHVAHAVDDIVIYEKAPRSPKRLDDIRDGLDALQRHFKKADEERRRA